LKLREEEKGKHGQEQYWKKIIREKTYKRQKFSKGELKKTRRGQRDV